MRVPPVSASFLVVLSLAAICSSAQVQSSTNHLNPKHDSEQWKQIEPHLPDPATASAQTLETEGDILRARRFPEDALDYYRHAVARAGESPRLLNKMGLVNLELHNTILARAYFQRVTKLSKKDPEGWNNLGAIDYLNGDTSRAISDYKKAIKLDRRKAVYHANLATAYFDRKDYNTAQREIASAMNLDPGIFDRKNDTGGVTAHILSSQDRARFAYEMAKMYARSGMEEQMLHSLALASEAGFDIRSEMRKDHDLAKLVDDPRILVIVKNAEALRASRGSGPAPAPLPESKPVAN